jgi:two-component system, chemotaxis family, sensor kinase CheA
MSAPLSEEFLPEAEELLEQMEVDLQSLEQVGLTPERVAERLNALFRSAHSIKGMAGMTGLTEVAHLSHEMEELMDHLRMGRLAPQPPIVVLIGEGVALLRRCVAMAAKAGTTDASLDRDATDYSQRLTQAMTATAGFSAPSLDTIGIPAHLFAALTTYEEHRLRENLRLGRAIYAVRVDFNLDDFDRQLASVTGRLQEQGELIATVPQLGEAEGPAPGSEFAPQPGRIGFELIIGSARTLQELSEGAGPPARVTALGAPPPGDVAATPAAPPDAAPQAARSGEAMASVRSLSDTVRVEIHQLDHLLNIMGELVLQKAVLYQLAKELIDREGSAGLAGSLLKSVQMVEHRLTELQEGLVEARMVPLGQLFDRLSRAARKLSRELGKSVDLRMSGEETRLDKTMVEAIADPLLHLIRNAMDHGLESTEARQAAGKPDAGQITLRARPQGTSVVIEVSDDGQGVNLPRVREIAVRKGLADPAKSHSDDAVIGFLFQPGFSTSEQVSEISGRGVGLDVVAKNIAAFNGLVDVTTTPGVGTTFSITLPITLVIVRALLVRAGVELFAVPLSNVTETLMGRPSDIQTVEGAEVIELRNHTLPLLRLREHFACPPVAETPGLTDQGEGELYIVVIGSAENRLGLVVDAIEGQQEIVIKTIGELLQGVISGVAGAAELGDRRMILVLDIPALLDEASLRVLAIGQ